DVRALARRGAGLERDRLLRQLERLWLVVRRHHRVDVRAQHQGLSPEGHGQLRIQARGLAERAPGFRVVEPIGQVHALADEPLRLRGRRRDAEDVRAQGLQARRQLTRRRRTVGRRRLLVVLVVRFLRRRGERGQKEREQRGAGPREPVDHRRLLEKGGYLTATR